MKKQDFIFCALLVCGALMAGCGSTSAAAAGASETGDSSVTAVETAALSAQAQEDAVSITLDTGKSSCDDSSVEIEGNTVTITREGSYILSGTLEGQIVIDAGEDAKVKLILNGAEIENQGNAAIYAISADKLVLASAAGSVNSLSSLGDFVQTDENKVDGAVYTVCDLTLSGEGTVQILCESGHAVVTRDDLKVKGGTWELEGTGKGLYGNDSVTIEDGVLNIQAGTDGIYSEKTEDPERGGILIQGGSVTITAGKEGLDATGTVSVEGGSLDITAGTAAGTEEGGKGIKSDTRIEISGGSITVVSADDAIHANDSVTVSGGELALSSGDDGIHADASLWIQDGSITILKSYEGLEANDITIDGGEISLTASDDGINAAGGSDGSNSFGPFGGDPFSGDGSSALIINGGTLEIDAGGDGLDANGQLTVNGGAVYVSGPTNNGNGALDYGTGASVNGGTVIAVGASGMAENFGSSSTQGSILLNLSSTQAAGSTVTVTDENGKILASFTPGKSYQSVVISAEGMVQGGTYTVTAGTVTQTITLDSLICGSGMGMGGFGGMGGQMGGPMQGGFGGQGGPMDGGFGGHGGFRG